MNIRNFKCVFIALFLVLISGAFLSGCSKKDSTPDNPDANTDVAVGTFKGKLTLYRPDNSSTDYFDAIVNVTKADGGKLTIGVKSGEDYSDATPKTFAVSYVGAGTDLAFVQEREGSVEGVFLYKIDIKTLQIVTQTQQADETNFSFEGTKQ